MEKIEKLGSAKRFGPRYGAKTKHLFAKIEKEQRKKHKCPYCHAIKVKRTAVGIWHCRKCNATFTGKAYSINKPIITEEEAEVKETGEKTVEETSEEVMEENEGVENG